MSTSGQYKMGINYLRSRELAVQYSVSRTSIREALRLLELNDLVEIRQGDGTFIKNNAHQAIQNQLTNVVLKTDRTTL